MTTIGWQKISTIADGTLIMQWDAKRDCLSFAPCKILSFDFCGNMKRVSGEQIQQTLTPDHRVPHWDARMQHFHVKAAKDVAEQSQQIIPLGGDYVGGNLDYPAYLAMLMADFSREEYQWRGSFSKERKINRFLALAKKFALSYKEYKDRPGYRRFGLPNKHNFPKKWGSWVLDLAPASAEVLIEEARHWDAHDRGSDFIFFTADKEQAEWFATLAHLTGRAATVRRAEQSAGSYSTTVMWWVNVKNRKHARVMRKNWSDYSYEGKVYCPTVPSTFWLMRENGFISITGNTNLQNITEELRHIFIADKGYKLVGIDAEQSDSRMVGYMCGLLFDDWTYLDACESGDLHTFVARLTWPDLGWNGNIKKDRKIADRRFYRHFSYRDTCKRLGHGCLTPDHEVLTRNGWVSIEKKPNEILQFDPIAKKSSFAQVSTWVDKIWTGPFCEWNNLSISAKMTAPHRVYYTTTADEYLNVTEAQKIPISARIPLGWGYIGGNCSDISPEIARLIAAYQCDGHWSGTG
ncbi:MAG: hypothetical protein ACREHG_05135, partial [Candidatus Saccharimonadales bacterium]